MQELLPFFSSALVPRQVADELLQTNRFSERYGLALTSEAALALAETRAAALRRCGRVEFGGGAVKKLIQAFCGSPYLYPSGYEKTLHALVEIFYYFKNESLEMLTDDELIALMRDCFDNRCHGSLELLQSRELEELARRLRFGEAWNAYEEPGSPEDEKERQDEHD